MKCAAGWGRGVLRGDLWGGKHIRFSVGDEDWETREHHFTVAGNIEEDGEEETDPNGWDWEASYINGTNRSVVK